MLKLYRIICSSTAGPVSSKTEEQILSSKTCQIRNGSKWELIRNLIFTVHCPHLQNTHRTRATTHKSRESLEAAIEPVCRRQSQLWGLFQHLASQSPLFVLGWGVRCTSYEDDDGVWLFIFSLSGSAALRLTVPVCVSSSSDLTTGVSPPLALVFWLSEEEVEDVEDMRDLASRPSRTCRKRPLLMTSSLLLFPWTASQIETYC